MFSNVPQLQESFQLGYRLMHTHSTGQIYSPAQSHDVMVHRRPTALDSCLGQSARHTQRVNDIFLDVYCQLDEQPRWALYQTLTIPQESSGIGQATRGVGVKEVITQRTNPRLPCFWHVQNGALNFSGFLAKPPESPPGFQSPHVKVCL